tara:strand:- start:90 stop:632 length:543 start_codon:yes stop_codon:yes gene_type:complete
MDKIFEVFNLIATFDLIYLVVTIIYLLQCTKKGFVLSLLSASKWLLAYVVTIFLFPKIKPYVKNLIDNEYVLDVSLGIVIFIVIIFFILLINKGISRAVTYSGIGSLDKVFGFCFGFLKSYIIIVCVYTTIDIIYTHDKWPIKLKDSISYRWVENGSNYLINEFPDQKQYEDAKDKVQEL